MRTHSIEVMLTPGEADLKDPTKGQSWQHIMEKQAKLLKKGKTVSISLIQSASAKFPSYLIKWDTPRASAHH